MAFVRDVDRRNAHVVELSERLVALVRSDAPREDVDALVRVTMGVFKKLKLTIGTQQNYFSLVRKYATEKFERYKNARQLRWFKFPVKSLKKLVSSREHKQKRVNRIKALAPEVIQDMYQSVIKLLDSDLEVLRLLAVMALTGRRFSDYFCASFTPRPDVWSAERGGSWDIAIADYVKSRESTPCPYVFPVCYDPAALVGEIALLRESFLTEENATRIHTALTNETRAFFKKCGLAMIGRVTPHALRKLYVVFALHTYDASKFGMTEPEFVAFALHDTMQASSIYYPLRMGKSLICLSSEAPPAPAAAPAVVADAGSSATQ